MFTFTGEILPPDPPTWGGVAETYLAKLCGQRGCSAELLSWWDVPLRLSCGGDLPGIKQREREREREGEKERERERETLDQAIPEGINPSTSGV